MLTGWSKEDLIGQRKFIYEVRFFYFSAVLVIGIFFLPLFSLSIRGLYIREDKSLAWPKHSHECQS